MDNSALKTTNIQKEVIREKILNVCSQRNDKWAEEVRIRALDCHDFVVAEARYHLPCHRDFTTGKRLSTATPGRPVVSEN